LLGKRYLIMDRDAKFSAGFRQILQNEGVKAVRLPARSPNLSPHIERFMRSIKEECLSRMIFFGQRWLENAVREYLLHHHQERGHQGLGNRLISPAEDAGRTMGAIDCRISLGRPAPLLLSSCRVIGKQQPHLRSASHRAPITRFRTASRSGLPVGDTISAESASPLPTLAHCPATSCASAECFGFTG
jgi:hypothetical protein